MFYRKVICTTLIWLLSSYIHGMDQLIDIQKLLLNEQINALFNEKQKDRAALQKIKHEKINLTFANYRYKKYLNLHPKHSFEQYCRYRDTAETDYITHIQKIEQKLDCFSDSIEEISFVNAHPTENLE